MAGSGEPLLLIHGLGGTRGTWRNVIDSLATTYTVIGHSLGGGIALQFAYQFPERTSRLAPISSGGLGSEVTVMLRAATWPGANTAVAGLGRPLSARDSR